MSVYQHILLAVDFLPEDDQIIQKVVNLELLTGAKLSLIHVLDNIPMPDVPYGTIIPLDREVTDTMLEAEKQKLRQTGDVLGIDPARRWLIWGEPREEIIRIAKQEDVDLIVVGSHGRHGLALLLGSTASSVLHYAKCDVLAVRLQDE